MKKILTLFLILSFCTLLTGCSSTFGKSEAEKKADKAIENLDNYPNPSVIIEKNDTNKDTKK